MKIILAMVAPNVSLLAAHGVPRKRVANADMTHGERKNVPRRRSMKNTGSGTTKIIAEAKSSSGNAD